MRAIRLFACLAALLGGCALVEAGPPPDEQATTVLGQAGAAAVTPPSSPSPITALAGAVALPVDEAAPDPSTDPPAAPPPVAIDGSGPIITRVTPGPSEPSEPTEPEPTEDDDWPTCPGIPEALFQVEGAGSGTLSGCAPRTCAGVSILPIDPMNPYGGPGRDPAEYSGCTVIEGDLVVADHARSDLAELACLERITGSVLIWRSPALTSLTGLESLQAIGGDLELGFHLDLVGGTDAIEHFDALANLRAIGGMLRIAGGEGLERWAELPRLEVVGGDVTFSSFPGVRELSGLNALRHIGGSFGLMQMRRMTAVTGLRALTTIGGMFWVWGSSDLVELQGLPSLSCIGDSVDIGGSDSWEANPVLRRVGAFPALRIVGNRLLLEHNAALESFELLSTVEHASFLVVTNNPLLTALPVDALTKSYRFEVHDNASLPDCDLRAVATRLGLEEYAQVLTNNAACP